MTEFALIPTKPQQGRGEQGKRMSLHRRRRAVLRLVPRFAGAEHSCVHWRDGSRAKPAARGASTAPVGLRYSEAVTLATGMPTNDKPKAANAKQPVLAPTGLDHACLAHVLGYQLARASVFTRNAFNHAIGEPMHLRPVEFTILELIAHNASATQKQLASALSMTAPGMTVLLDRLEERGDPVPRIRTVR